MKYQLHLTVTFKGHRAALGTNAQMSNVQGEQSQQQQRVDRLFLQS